MAVFWQSLPLKPLEPLELFSLSLFGTEFVHKTVVMSPVGEAVSRLARSKACCAWVMAAT